MMGVIRALVTVTLQPINYLLYINNSAFSGIIKYNRHFKGAKIQRKMKPIIYDGFMEVF
jgi:hypothetical protein